MKKIKKQIKKYLKKYKEQAFKIEEIAEYLNINSSEDYTLLIQSIAQMEQYGDIVFTSQGYIQWKDHDQKLQGTFMKNERGFGFVSIPDWDHDVFIAKQDTLTAMYGDIVEIQLKKTASHAANKSQEGIITHITERKNHQIVGELVEIFRTKENPNISLGRLIAQDKKLADYRIIIELPKDTPELGTICIMEIIEYPNEASPHFIKGLLKTTLGHKNDPGVDILSAIHKFQLPIEFPESVLLEAEARLTEVDIDQEASKRKDYRDQWIVTIDGADAKDLDDAISLTVLDNGHYLLGVHIADVAQYVIKDSLLDQEALKRGTSVYLTDRVIPMLPRALSNGMCSLNPNEDRLALTCEMEINTEGNVLHYSIVPSVINSNYRLTYDEVNLFFNDQDVHFKKDKDVQNMLKNMKELHEILEKKRIQRGAITFEDREAKIEVDALNRPINIFVRERGISERMIESFMLAANETVAEYFYHQKLPMIYRIHLSPKKEALQRFFNFMSTLGISVYGTKETLTPKEIQHVLESVHDKPEAPIINMMLLRSMQQARYDTHSLGHYGLAATHYTHFTSPIRRYPDLMVHRLLHQSFQGNVDCDQEKLQEIADYSSWTERRSVDAERDVEAMKKAEYMTQFIDETFKGVISSVTNFGLFVGLDNTVEGLVHVSTMKGDYFNYVESQLALVGERTHRRYRIGDEVVVRVVKANPKTREVDFELVTDHTDTLRQEKQTKNKRKQNKRRKKYKKKENKQKNIKKTNK